MKKTPTKKTIIVDRDAPVLREVAQPVPIEAIGSKKLEAIIAKMIKAVHGEDDGVAIAAPQIGESLRIFVVKGSAFAIAKNVDEKEERFPDLVFINPEIVKTSKKRKNMEEGCLSVRWLYGEVSRFEKVTITAYNEAGECITVGASGLIAQIFQHEIDHLNGILFIDTATNVRDLPPTHEPTD
jgi:peptide deformylase